MQHNKCVTLLFPQILFLNNSKINIMIFYLKILDLVIFFTVLQYNIRGLSGKSSELYNYIENLADPPKVICLQETLLNGQDTIELIDYAMVQRNRLSNRGGGCAIYIHKSFNFKILEISQNIECIKIKVFCQNFECIIVNVYNPGNITRLEDLDELMPKTPGKNVLILGDFNAHNPLWGSKLKNIIGKNIEEFVDKNNLIILNNGSPTRHDVYHKSFSNIDLAFSSPELATKAYWRVDYDIMTSDHFPILIDFHISSLQNNNVYTNTNNISFNYSKADWGLYKELTKAIHEEEIIDANIDIHYSNFIHFIKTCARKAVPVSSQHKSHPNPWWTNKCNKAIKDRNRAKRKYLKTLTPSHLENYKKMKNIAQRTIRQARTSYWKKYCEGLNKYVPTKKVWNKIKNMSSSGIALENTYPLQHNDKLINDSKIKSDIMADHFAKKLFSNNPNPLSENNDETFETKTNSPYDPINEDFNINELNQTIDSMNNSAPGIDNIHKQLLYNLHDNSKIVLLNLLNKIWHGGQLPTSWHHAIIIPIPKQGKDKTLPTGYRPVSLTCTICKLAEKLISNRLIWYLESNDILLPEQSGFRPGRSVMDNILHLCNDVNKAWAFN